MKMKMSTKIFKNSDEITYYIRSKDGNVEYVIFSSSKELDLEIGETLDEILIKMTTPYGNYQTYKTICYSIVDAKVVEIVEEKNQFKYRVNGDIEYLKFWKFNEKLK
jgi:Asp-tRNA(Asn)/Glu-tRNA(Gln) amidotransferase B subunit